MSPTCNGDEAEHAAFLGCRALPEPPTAHPPPQEYVDELWQQWRDGRLVKKITKRIKVGADEEGFIPDEIEGRERAKVSIWEFAVPMLQCAVKCHASATTQGPPRLCTQITLFIDTMEDEQEEQDRFQREYEKQLQKIVEDETMRLQYLVEDPRLSPIGNAVSWALRMLKLAAPLSEESFDNDLQFLKRLVDEFCQEDEKPSLQEILFVPKIYTAEELAALADEEFPDYDSEDLD